MVDRVELIFGLVGPIGCPMHEAEEALRTALHRVGYSVSPISLSSSMRSLLEAKSVSPSEEGESELERKIADGNAVRAAFRKNSVLGAQAIQMVRSARRKIHVQKGRSDEDHLDGVPVDEHAFIIRQFKRPEEVELLTKVFGKRFIQVSVVSPLEKRKQALSSRLMREKGAWTVHQCEDHADKLIRIDQNEEDQDRGQRISKIFHLADVFLDGRSQSELEKSSYRFIDVLFGRNDIGPSRDEFGSYSAKGAALRSVDLSRQVGASIFSAEGDLISIGCNDVPKALGGVFWDDDKERHRDIDVGGEANRREINRIVFDFLGTLKELGLIQNNLKPSEILERTDAKDAILESMVGGITEYGRMVHAEMNALTDAARLGRSVKGATIFVTTYPCHNCAKHLVAAGIKRIVFVEPYPKSKAELLFKNIIEPDSASDHLVSIEHFYGISPRRFRDFFEKGKRQSKTGIIQAWYNNQKAPRLGSFAIAATEQEVHALNEILFAETD